MVGKDVSVGGCKDPSAVPRNLPLLERLQQLDQQPGFEELTVDREALRTFCL